MTRPRRPRRADRSDDPRVGLGSDVGAGGAQGGGGLDAPADGGRLRYATTYHAPVLPAETVAALVTDTAGLYVDGTLGGGGHAAALLDALGPDALVVGIDQDPEALATARTRLAEAEAAGRFVALRGNFGDLDSLLARNDLGPTHGRAAAGVLLDLGVSSHQLDQAARGFAYGQDGPLDMRMGDRGETAAALVARLRTDDLADVLYQYGEERRSRAIARAIKRAAPTTTAALAAAVRESVPTRDELKSLARVFQALRIAVNGEMDVLERALPAALDVLAEGGRLAVIAYHSLEDRRAKQFLRTGRFSAQVEKDAFGNPITPWRAVTRKPIVATDAEVAQNPRARSARLRVAEKITGDASSPTEPPERRPGA
ncbi:16S rRNA (cytosine(1402)-N(4))-methyltransferase RsmH [Rubrivirga sp.]|uniref:16S rRNA (cytosine(1402)-N(4))-methyltransferase RsmH n=1 Tax=Rubrivirga sp. TaxID=1885344 RepID=UPI003B521E43